MKRIKTWWGALTAGAAELADDEAGDVPGWVLVTLMTAGLPALTARG